MFGLGIALPSFLTCQHGVLAKIYLKRRILTIIGVTHDNDGRVVQRLSVSTKVSIGLPPNGDRNHPRMPGCSQRPESKVARADFAVRVLSVAIIATVPYSIAVSKLRRRFLSDQYFFIIVRLLRRREKFTELDFALLARAFNRARALHLFDLTAWVFLPDPAAAGHRICAPVYPVTISLAMKSVKQSSRSGVNQRRGGVVASSAVSAP